MKLTSIEKKMAAAIVVLSILIAFNVYYITQKIDEAGGIKGIIIETGKEIKDIKKQIENAP